jgi:hypothetical protein
MDLYNKTNYTADISYLSNVFITEYDISKANINVLYSMNMIDLDTYDYLYKAQKMVRERYIGMLQKSDVKYTKALQEGIRHYRELLFKSNGLSDSDVLAIKNDAIFVINKDLANTKFGLIEFKKKNTYTAFYKLKHLEIYYFYNPMSKEEIIDIKGISDSKLELHKNGFIQILKDIFCTIQIDGVLTALNMVKNIYSMYVNYQFPIEVYREFNNDSKYHLNIITRYNAGFYLDSISDKDKYSIDISTNLALLTEINKILYHMYFNN